MTETVDRTAARWGPTILRWAAGLLWLSNVSWKIPPQFGEAGGGCGGLCNFIGDGAENPVLPGSAWMLEQIIGPRLGAFGWVILFVEASLAALLLSGRFLRVAAVVGIVQSFAIFAAVANAPEEWYWSYFLMIALHLAILVTAHDARRPTQRSASWVIIGYGLIVAVAHISAGLTGDNNRDWTLFGAQNDFPGDFGKNVFPGSIALGLLFIGLGAISAAMTQRVATRPISLRAQQCIGYGLVGAAVILLVTYRSSGLALGLGSRATTSCVIAALGLIIARPTDRTQDDPTEVEEHEPAPQHSEQIAR